MDITKLVSRAADMQRAKGWPDRSVPEDIALMHSELSEALEEHRKGFPPTITYHKFDAHGDFKPEGIPSEMADTVIRIAAFCGVHGIDLAAAIEEKMEFNSKRPMRHGNKVI